MSARAEKEAVDRPLDEIYDTMMEVERNPTGAFMAIQALSAERYALEAEAAKVDALMAAGFAEYERRLEQAWAEVARLRGALDEIAGIGFSEPMTWSGTEAEWERRRANIMQATARAFLARHQKETDQ